MTGAASLPLVRKEVRALLPVWLASAAAIAICAAAGEGTGLEDLREWGLLVYIFGATMLGALSIGHEYSYRTLSQLLAQPDDRRHLLGAKLAALVLLLTALALITWGAVVRLASGDTGSGSLLSEMPAATIVIIPICALCVAPWLTMASRNPYAGVVFTLALYATLWVTGEIAAAGLRSAWDDVPSHVAVRARVLWAGLSVASAIAGVLGWQTFMRLESLGDAGDGLPGHGSPRTHGTVPGRRAGEQRRPPCCWWGRSFGCNGPPSPLPRST